MEIRKATDGDIPAIISLLKLSLGESLMPKTEAFYRWKHLENPFGESMVLVAEEDGVLIGLRAFMHWQWQKNADVLKAVRAVDTATHPDHQGKGIFKKLTLKGIDEVKELGTDIVYNTPNSKSKPGYLKMGWQEQGRMSLKVSLNPFGYKKPMPVLTTDWTQLNPGPDFFNQAHNGINTLYSKAYIDWRYAKNPMFDYHYLTDNCSYLLVYRFKKHSFGVELRIVDLLVAEKNFNAATRKELKKALAQVSRKVIFTSVSGNHYTALRKYYPGLGLIPVLNKGPMVTLRNVQLSAESFDALLTPAAWLYSLGDLELF